MNTQEPTLSDLENQEPQAQLDQEQPETFVALSTETVRMLVSMAMFLETNMDPLAADSAILEASQAYAEATGQQLPLSLKKREVSPGAIYPDATRGEL